MTNHQRTTSTRDKLAKAVLETLERRVYLASVSSQLFDIHQRPQALQVTFNSAINASSLDSSDVSLLNISTGVVVKTEEIGSVSYNASTKTATFGDFNLTGDNTLRPASTLPNGLWQATVNTSGILDSNGQPLTGSNSYEFLVQYGNTNVPGTGRDYPSNAIEPPHAVDGTIDADDYGRIDLGFQNQNTNSAYANWYHGDFDSNGIINADDYAYIDVYFGTHISYPLAQDPTRQLTASSGVIAGKVSLTWLPPAGGTWDSYRIMRSSDGVSFGTLAEIADPGPLDASGKRTWIDGIDLVDGKKYTYRVYGVSDTAGLSGGSNRATAVIPISTPNGLTADSITSTSAVLKWNDQSLHEEGFNIFAATSGAPFQQVGRLVGIHNGSDPITYTVTGLTPGTIYTFRTQAYTSDDVSAFSLPTTFTTSAASAMPPKIAGPSTAELGDWITLSGSGGYSSEGTFPLSYVWSIEKDGTVVQSSSGTSVSFSAASLGNYTAHLLVLGGAGGPAAADDFTLTVTPPQLADIPIFGPDTAAIGHAAVFNTVIDRTDARLKDAIFSPRADAEPNSYFKWTVYDGSQTIQVAAGPSSQTCPYIPTHAGQFSIKCVVVVQEHEIFRGTKTFTAVAAAEASVRIHAVADTGGNNLATVQSVELPDGNILTLNTPTETEYGGLGGDNTNFGYLQLLTPRLDPIQTWGNASRVTLPFVTGTSERSVGKFAVQPDGKIIVAYLGTIRRFNADGSVDSGFQNSTFSLTRFAALLLQPDGKIVVGGERSVPDTLQSAKSFREAFELTRFNSDGTLDAGATDSTPADSFGTDGTVIVKVTPDSLMPVQTTGGFNSVASSGIETITTLTSQQVGNDFMIVAGGMTSRWLNPITRDHSDSMFALIRLDRDGNVDTNFGSVGDGRIYTDFKDPASAFTSGGIIGSLSIAPDGKIVAIGTAVQTMHSGSGDNGWLSSGTLLPVDPFINGGQYDAPAAFRPNLALVRYTADGHLDPSFGVGGVQITAQPNGVAWTGYVDEQSRIVVGASAANEGLVARFNPDGSPDTSFNNGNTASSTGAVFIDLNAPADDPQPAERIVLDSRIPTWTSIFYSQRGGDFVLAGPAFPSEATSVASTGGLIARFKPISPALADLTATALPDGPVALRWIDSGTGEDGFKITRVRDDSSSDNPTVTFYVGAGETTYTDELVTPNTTYKYTVVPYNTVNQSIHETSDMSATATVTTVPINTSFVLDESILVPLDGSPVTSHASLASKEAYELRAKGVYFLGARNVWSDNDQLADAEYGIQNSYNDNSPMSGIDYGIAVFDGTAATAGVSALKDPFWGNPANDAAHSYTILHTGLSQPITLRLNDDNYPDNRTASGYPQLTLDLYRALPSAPAYLTATPNKAAKQIALSWENLSSATKIVVERQEGDGNFSTVASLSGTATGFADTTVAINHRYSYRIKAVTAFGESSYSNISTAVIVNLAPIVPIIPTQIAAAGEEFRFTIPAHDPEDGANGLHYAILNPLQNDSGGTGMLPTSDNANETGIVSGWTPTEADRFDTYGDSTEARSVTIRVWDEEGWADRTTLGDRATYRDQVLPILIAPTPATRPVVTDATVVQLDTTSVNLHAVATFAGGEPNLTYTWSILSRPAGAASPTFGDPTHPNGTNSSKDLIADLHKAGTYQFRVTVSSGDGWPVTRDTVTITVDQVLSSVSITPASFSASASSTHGVSGIASDQFGIPMQGTISYVWSLQQPSNLSSNQLGSVSSTTDPSMTYTAPASIAAARIDTLQLLVSATMNGNTVALSAGGAINLAAHNTAPVFVSEPDGEAINFSQIRLTTLGHDADEDDPESTLTYTWEAISPASPVSFSVNGTNAAKTVIATCDPNLPLQYKFKVTVRDSKGASVSDFIEFTDSRNLTSVVLTPADSSLTIGHTTNISVALYDQYGRKIVVGGTAPTYSWSVDGIAQTGSGSTFSYTAISSNLGTHSIGVQASLNGYQASATGHVNVVGDLPPTYKIVSPWTGPTQAPLVLTKDTPVNIVVDDVNDDPVEWYLWLTPNNGSRELLASSHSEIGSAPANGGTAYTLTPSELANGLYKLELTSSATGTPVLDSTYVDVRTDLKLGSLNLPMTDLQVDVPGSNSISANRQYDSMKSTFLGDFGYGWQLDLTNTDLHTTIKPDGGRLETETGLRLGDLVYLTLPGEGERAFQFLPKAQQANSLGNIYFTPQFVEVDGGSSTLNVNLRSAPKSSLETEGSIIQLTRQSDGTYWDYNTQTPYNPANPITYYNSKPIFGNAYTVGSLTDESEAVIDATSGEIVSQKDANGNSVEVLGTGTAGVDVRKNGKYVLSVRDKSVSTAAPIRYFYDVLAANSDTSGAGNLIGMIDRAGERTTYAYADRLVTAYNGGGAVYAVLTRDDGKVWNDSTKTFETLNNSNWASYAVPTAAGNGPESAAVGAAVVSTSAWHIAQVPADISAGTIVNVSYRVRSGTSALQQDNQVDSETNRWVDPSRHHYLTTITDSRGVRVLAAQYDATGQLSKLSDSTGKAATVTDGGVAGKSKVVTDLAGNQTESIYDDHGQVVREIKSVSVNGIVTKYIVTVHDYGYGDDPNLYDAQRSGYTNLNKLYSQTDWLPFEADAANRYSQKPAEHSEQSRTVFNTYSSAANVTPRPQDWLPQTQSVRGPNGTPIQTTFSDYKAGHPQTVTTDTGTTRSSYDDAGNLLWSVDPQGNGTWNVYSTTDALSSTDPFRAYRSDLKIGQLLETYKFHFDATTANPAPSDAFFATYSGTRTLVAKNDYFANSLTDGSGGRLKSTTNNAGVITSYTYTALGQVDVVSHKNSSSGTAILDSDNDYDASGRVTKVIGWKEKYTQTHYDSAGRVDYTTDVHGGTTTNTYDVHGNLIRTLYPDGTETRTSYDVMGRAEWTSDRNTAAVLDAGSLATRTIYDSLGRSVGTERYTNAIIAIGNDTVAGHGIQGATTPDAAALRLAGHRLSSTSTVYDAQGRVAESVDASGLRSGTLYTAGGQVSVSGIVDANAPQDWFARSNPSSYLTSTTTHQYDILTTSPAGAVKYDMVTDPRGITTKTFRDSFGQAFATTVTKPSNDSTTPLSSITTMTLVGVGTARTSIYTATTFASQMPGQTITGHQETDIDALNRATDRFYDVNGQLTDVWLPAVPDPKNGNAMTRPHWHYTYDVSGNQLSQVDPYGHTTSYTYDDQGHRLTRTLPADSDGVTINDTESWTYDDFGQVLTHTDFMGQTTAYLYDASGTHGGRLIAEYRFINGVTAMSGQTILIANAAESTTYTYDALGRKSVVTENPSGATTTYTYDPITGGVASIASSLTGKINYTYDAVTGRHVRTWSEDGYNDTAYSYDAQGRLSATTILRLNSATAFGTYGGIDPATHNPIVTAAGVKLPLVTSYGYDLDGNLASSSDDMGTSDTADDLVTTYSYDGYNRLTTEMTTLGGVDDFKQQFTVDAGGRRSSVIETRFSAFDGDVVTNATWHYDDDDRLTGEDRSDGTTSTKDYYTLDLVGNRLKKASDTDGDDTVDQTTLYVYNDRDELTSSGVDADLDGAIDTATKTTNGYDADGNQKLVTAGGAIKRYVWDLRNRMTGIDSNNDGDTSDVGDFNYGYDSDGVRISESTKTSSYTRTTFYLNDPQNPTGYAKAIEERAVTTPNSGSVTTTYRSFALGQKVEAQADATNGVLYLMTDGHGSTRALISTTGDTLQNFDYDAFGTPIGFVASNAKTPWLFGGDGLYDPASKFTYHLARWRDGFRFISYDSFEADPGSPAGFHKYLYANANPINVIDPSGHEGLADLLVSAGIYIQQQGVRIGTAFAAGATAVGRIWNVIGAEAESFAQNVIEEVLPDAAVVEEDVAAVSSKIDFRIVYNNLRAWIEVKYRLPEDGGSLTRAVNQLTNIASVAPKADGIVVWAFRTPSLTERLAFLDKLAPQVAARVQVLGGIDGLATWLKSFFH